MSLNGIEEGELEVKIRNLEERFEVRVKRGWKNNVVIKGVELAEAERETLEEVVEKFRQDKLDIEIVVKPAIKRTQSVLLVA